MSNNTSFSSRSTSGGKPTVYQSDQSLIARYDEALPTEFTYHMDQSNSKYFYTQTKKARELVHSHLKELNFSEEQCKAALNDFSDDCYVIYDKNLEELKHDEKILTDAMIKIGKAVENMTKTRILEYVGRMHELQQKQEKELEQLAKDYVKRKAKA